MELYRVQVVDPHTLKALIDACRNVVSSEHMVAWWEAADRATALGRQEELVAPVRDVLPNELLAPPVVDRRVDEVDAGVEHCVQHLARLVVIDGPASISSPDLHRAVAKSRDFESAASKGILLQSSVHPVLLLCWFRLHLGKLRRKGAHDRLIVARELHRLVAELRRNVREAVVVVVDLEVHEL